MTRPTAISKNVAMTQLTQEVESFMESAVPTINKQLMNFTTGANRIIYASSLGINRLTADAQGRAVEEIKKEYTAQGWTVKFTYGDQRDGDNWFNFS